MAKVFILHEVKCHPNWFQKSLKESKEFSVLYHCTKFGRNWSVTVLMQANVMLIVCLSLCLVGVFFACLGGGGILFVCLFVCLFACLLLSTKSQKYEFLT